jgi:hypothetical protein
MEFFLKAQAHRVGRGVVQMQNQELELHHLPKPAGQLMEQRGQIPVRHESVRHCQKSSVLVTV